MKNSEAVAITILIGLPLIWLFSDGYIEKKVRNSLAYQNTYELYPARSSSFAYGLNKINGDVFLITPKEVKLIGNLEDEKLKETLKEDPLNLFGNSKDNKFKNIDLSKIPDAN